MFFCSTFRSILTVPWVELGGKTEISCSKTGYRADIEFHTKVSQTLDLLPEIPCFPLLFDLMTSLSLTRWFSEVYRIDSRNLEYLSCYMLK